MLLKNLIYNQKLGVSYYLTSSGGCVFVFRLFLLLAFTIILSACASTPERVVMQREPLPLSQPESIDKKDYNSFLLAYHQSVFDLLEFVKTQPQKQGKEIHFLILENPHERYVQCFLDENDAQADCEVDSGLWRKKHAGLSRKARHFLARQDFTIKEHPGNYQRDIDNADSPQGLWNISDLMLELLYRTYGAHIGDVKAVYPVWASTQE